MEKDKYFSDSERQLELMEVATLEDNIQPTAENSLTVTETDVAGVHTVDEARRAVDAAYFQETTKKPQNGEDSTESSTSRSFSFASEEGMFAPFRTFAKTEREPIVRVRRALEEDVPRLVEVDMAGYSDVYAETRPEPLKIEAMLRERLSTIRQHGGERWMLVGEVGGKVEGFMTGQPTNKTPEAFTSWEEATDDGTMRDTYEENGRNLYVVNLTVTKRGSKYGITDMMIGNMYGSLIKANIDQGIFSSRMPGFRSWAERQLTEEEDQLENLGEKELDALAEEYFNARRKKDGGRLDGQLRRYENSGFKLQRLVRGGFEDPSSLGYGVLCTADNLLPQRLRHRPITWAAGGLLKLIARSPKLIARVF